MDLLQSVSEAALCGEFILLQRQDELIAVLEGIVIELSKGGQTVELSGVHLKHKILLAIFAFLKHTHY